MVSHWSDGGTLLILGVAGLLCSSLRCWQSSCPALLYLSHFTTSLLSLPLSVLAVLSLFFLCVCPCDCCITAVWRLSSSSSSGEPSPHFNMARYTTQTHTHTHQYIHFLFQKFPGCLSQENGAKPCSPDPHIYLLLLFILW